MSTQAIIEAVKQYKIIAIMRNVAVKDVEPVAEALYEGGIRLVEVTVNQETEDGLAIATESIARLSEKFGTRLFIGAGTVLSTAEVDAVAAAGATYIVSPNMDLAVIRHTVESGLVSIPGVFSPSEIVQAYDAGAAFVKVFPAETLGAKFFKAVRGPLGHIQLLAVGGIDHLNMGEFLDAGAVGVGIGSNIVNTRLIKEAKYTQLTDLARKYTSQIEKRS